jgi:hypothetical protein
MKETADEETKNLAQQDPTKLSDEATDVEQRNQTEKLKVSSRC